MDPSSVGDGQSNIYISPPPPSSSPLFPPLLLSLLFLSLLLPITIGTYCQQREVEAISESIADNNGFCCTELGHLPGVLSCNMMVCTRWMSWQVASSCYIIHGYSISENQANLVFNTYEFKKRYLSYYCKVSGLMCTGFRELLGI